MSIIILEQIRGSFHTHVFAETAVLKLQVSLIEKKLGIYLFISDNRFPKQPIGQNTCFIYTQGEQRY